MTNKTITHPFPEHEKLRTRQPRSGMLGTCYRCFNDGWDAHKRGSHPANFHAGFATPDAPHTCDQHSILIEQREQLVEVLRLIQGFNWQLDDSPHGLEIKRRAELVLTTIEQGN